MQTNISFDGVCEWKIYVGLMLARVARDICFDISQTLKNKIE